MAIDVNTLVANHPKGEGFAYHFQSVDASGGEEIIAAPGAGKRLVIEALMVMTNVAQGSSIAVTFKSATTDTFGPFDIDSENSPVVFPIVNSGVVMGVNEAFNITAEAGEVSGYVQGRITG